MNYRDYMAQLEREDAERIAADEQLEMEIAEAIHEGSDGALEWAWEQSYPTGYMQCRRPSFGGEA